MAAVAAAAVAAAVTKEDVGNTGFRLFRVPLN